MTHPLRHLLIRHIQDLFVVEFEIPVLHRVVEQVVIEFVIILDVFFDWNLVVHRLTAVFACVVFGVFHQVRVSGFNGALFVFVLEQIYPERLTPDAEVTNPPRKEECDKMILDLGYFCIARVVETR